MPNNSIALSVTPPGDGLAFQTGMQSAQKTRLNQQAIESNDEQQRLRDLQLRSAIMSQAMEVGAGSPQDWDSAMDAAVEAGAPEAAQYKGQWSPARASRLSHAYGGVPEQALGHATGVGSPGAPAAAPAAAAGGDSGEQQYDARIMQAIEQMKPEQRRQKLEQYNYALRAMNGVRSTADIPALIDHLVEFGLDGAEQFRGRLGGPDPWGEFNNVYHHIAKLHDFLADRQDSDTLGLGPAPQQPKYDIHWGGKDEPDRISTTLPGGGPPSIAYARPTNTPPGGGSPSGIGAMSTDQSNWVRQVDNFRQEFEQQNQNFIVVRDAFRGLAHMPKTTAGQMGTIYGIMKLFDPGSSVREGEYASAENTKGVPDMIRNMWNKVQSGTILTPTQIKNFRKVAATLYKQALESYHGKEKEFQGIAKERRYPLTQAVPDLSLGLKPDEIINAPVDDGEDDAIHEDDLVPHNQPPPPGSSWGRSR